MWLGLCNIYVQCMLLPPDFLTYGLQTLLIMFKGFGFVCHS